MRRGEEEARTREEEEASHRLLASPVIASRLTCCSADADWLFLGETLPLLQPAGGLLAWRFTYARTEK